MSDTFDVFAKPVVAPKAPAANSAPAAQAPVKKQWVNKPAKKRQYQPKVQKANNSPLRGANGEESVNPLLNAPLPQEQKAAPVQEAQIGNRNLDLPEFRLADIQTWTAPEIVEKMMPGADPEELGSYRKHELIFAAIRQYLSKGGAVLASGCL